MRVEIVRVVGIAFLTLFVSACSTTQYRPASSDVSLSYFTDLTDKEKQANYEAVLFSLDTLAPGEEMRWQEQDAVGYIKVFAGYQQDNGFCKQLSVQIQKKGYVKDVQETACRSFTGSKTWIFR